MDYLNLKNYDNPTTYDASIASQPELLMRWLNLFSLNFLICKITLYIATTQFSSVQFSSMQFKLGGYYNRKTPHHTTV